MLAFTVSAPNETPLVIINLPVDPGGMCFPRKVLAGGFQFAGLDRKTRPGDLETRDQ